MTNAGYREESGERRSGTRFGPLSRNVISYLSGYTGFLILEFVTLILLLTTVLFFFGVEITPYQVVLAFVATAATPFVYRPGSEPHGFGCAVALTSFFGLLCIVSVLLSASFYDTSFDGQGYRQEAIIQLADGWNPVHEWLPDEVQRSIWINHYPKGPWVLAAALYDFSRGIEYGKAFNLLLIFASFFLVLSLLLLIKQVQSRWAFVVSLLLALNPVSVYQSLSFYVDGQLSSLLVCLLASLTAVLIAADALTTASLSFVIIMALNVKFTGVPYVVFFGLSFLVVAAVMHKIRSVKQVIGMSASCFVIGLLVVGYNPYVINTMQYGHPFYPLFGADRIDIMQGEAATPLSLKGLNRLEKLFHSVFAASSGTVSQATELKIPFTVTDLQEIRTFGTPSTRTSGWGPLFGGALVLSIFGLVWTSARSPPTRRTAFIVAAMSLVILASALIHAEGWWARFAPQLYFIPMIVTLFLVSVRQRFASIIGGILAAALTLNIAMVGASYLYRSAKHTYMLNIQLDDLARVDGPVQVFFDEFRSTRIRFREAAIDYDEARTEDGLSCKHPVEIVKATALVCP